MKTVKPLRLGILTRPYRWQGVDQLGVAVTAFASLGAEPKLMADQELWQTVGEEIGGLGVFDAGVPKCMPEVLASGHGYTHHQQDKTACAVRLRVADLEKSLHVSGERYWLDGRLTAPQPFEAMPLDWAHAYGGRACRRTRQASARSTSSSTASARAAHPTWRPFMPACARAGRRWRPRASAPCPSTARSAWL